MFLVWEWGLPKRERNINIFSFSFSSFMAGPLRPQIVLFGSSIIQMSFDNGGWGAILANLYARKVLLLFSFIVFKTLLCIFCFSHHSFFSFFNKPHHNFVIIFFISPPSKSCSEDSSHLSIKLWKWCDTDSSYVWCMTLYIYVGICMYILFCPYRWWIMNLN